jgi:Alpha-L-arabinofuranosidase B (ABFB) domain
VTCSSHRHVQAQAVMTPNPADNSMARRKHSFLLRRGLSSRADGFSLESVYMPGTFLVSGVPAKEDLKCVELNSR